MSNSVVMSRRDLLLGSLKAAGFLLLSTWGLTGCKKKSAISAVEPVIGNFTKCPGQDNLSEEDKVKRQSLKYVDQSPIATRTCDNCKLYTKPAIKDACGGCKILPGPVHPKGYCVAWIHLM